MANIFSLFYRVNINLKDRIDHDVVKYRVVLSMSILDMNFIQLIMYLVYMIVSIWLPSHWIFTDELLIRKVRTIYKSINDLLDFIVLKRKQEKLRINDLNKLGTIIKNPRKMDFIRSNPYEQMKILTKSRVLKSDLDFILREKVLLINLPPIKDSIKRFNKDPTHIELKESLGNKYEVSNNFNLVSNKSIKLDKKIMTEWRIKSDETLVPADKGMGVVSIPIDELKEAENKYVSENYKQLHLDNQVFFHKNRNYKLKDVPTLRLMAKVHKKEKKYRPIVNQREFWKKEQEEILDAVNYSANIFSFVKRVQSISTDLKVETYDCTDAYTNLDHNTIYEAWDYFYGRIVPVERIKEIVSRSIIRFRRKFYLQNKGIPMGYSISPLLCETVIRYILRGHENEFLLYIDDLLFEGENGEIMRAKLRNKGIQTVNSEMEFVGVKIHKGYKNYYTNYILNLSRLNSIVKNKWTKSILAAEKTRILRLNTNIKMMEIQITEVDKICSKLGISNLMTNWSQMRADYNVSRELKNLNRRLEWSINLPNSKYKYKDTVASELYK